MSANNMSDLDAQEALAREYNPTLEGPLVGEIRSSLAIAVEYAKADPIYVAKTAALPQKYSSYRPILGDGNCGWRAAGFSYFETLLRLGDAEQLEEEVARMTSLDNLLTNVGGFSSYIFEDMVEETTGLLRDLARLMPTSSSAASDLLQERFNNPEVSNAIVYHFRLLASARIAQQPDLYQAYITDDIGVDGYRKGWLEPVNQEIDHLGMTLLIDVLLKPIGFAVEIVYLDRSEGTQVNSHIVQPEDANGNPANPGGPMIHLLYRPSHYDILYKEAPPLPAIPNPAQYANVQIHRVASLPHQHVIQNTPMAGYPSEIDSLFSIPGFTLLQPSPRDLPGQFQSPIEHAYAASPGPSISPISAEASSANTPSSTGMSSVFSSQPPPPLPKPGVTSSHQQFPQGSALPVQSHLPPSRGPPLKTQPILPSELPSRGSAASTFRPSKYEWEAAADWGSDGPVQFLTSTFKNSHYNTAHYNNPNFQPEEWTPDMDELPSTRKRSSG
ncbi:peptidase C65 Otubain-domain-containing protein [Amylocarpus encephaloides]|uniref:ubiquitinyl hydrolase 1 n=1 Tax=Amylocarpus encephaloides TaxID=45428 RepID=A0A9P8C0I6_9HELO|nr:peptidase C65 Otubain-domain-containing protein [Amylocarpus encephaloides]